MGTSDPLPNGPWTAEESDLWVERFFVLVERAGQGPLLRKNLQSFFRLTTDYSGTVPENMRSYDALLSLFEALPYYLPGILD